MDDFDDPTVIIPRERAVDLMRADPLHVRTWSRAAEPLLRQPDLRETAEIPRLEE